MNELKTKKAEVITELLNYTKFPNQENFLKFAKTFQSLTIREKESVKTQLLLDDDVDLFREFMVNVAYSYMLRESKVI